MADSIQLHVSIEKCPIVDALIEIRFDTKVNPSAVFGLIYGVLMQKYPGQVINLPILQLPEAVRNSDPALKYKPLYRIVNENVIIQIGPDVLSISSVIPYIGWESFKEHAAEIIRQVITADIINRVSRLGHRYINFFESNILNQITMSFNMTEGYGIQNVQITTQVKDNDFDNTIQFSNSAMLNVNSPSQKNGSIIDIDTFKEYSDNYFLENIVSEIEHAHKTEKTLFFSLLKPDFIKSLNPHY